MMYTPDERDTVVALDVVPKQSAGAPCPVLWASDIKLVLCYCVDIERLSENGLAIITFDRPYAHYFGPPNDEALSGHPLQSRGILPYGAFEIVESSWVRSLERLNRVHRHHNASRFKKLRHLLFAFYDTMFECVVDGILSIRTSQKDEVGKFNSPDHPRFRLDSGGAG